MKRNIYICISVILLASTVLAYNEEHGPFSRDSKLKKIILAEIPSRSFHINTNDATAEFVFVTTGTKPTRLRVFCEPKKDSVEITMADRIILDKTPFSSYGTAGGLMAYTADLNQDGIPDFIVYSFSGGCGLAGGNCNVAFILSSGKEFSLTTVATLFPDAGDFVMFNGTPCFIHTAFLSVDKCSDGKGHNFWVYNLLAFGKGEIKINNADASGFPKIIWYTFNPSHSEATIITEDQKKQLRNLSMTEIFWKRQDS